MNTERAPLLTAALFAQKGDATAVGFVRPLTIQPERRPRRSFAAADSALPSVAFAAALFVTGAAALVALYRTDDRQIAAPPAPTIASAPQPKPEPASFSMEQARTLIAPAGATLKKPVEPVLLIPPASDDIPPPPPLQVATLDPMANKFPPAEPSATVAGRYRVQLVSLGSAAAVRREWRRLKSTHADVLSGLGLTVKSSPTGSFYRLQVGPLTSRAAAQQLCFKLKRERTGCFVVSR